MAQRYRVSGPRGTNIPMLLTAAVLLIGGAVRVAQSDQFTGGALLAAGLMITGGWVALEASVLGHWLRAEAESDNEDDE